MERKIGDVFYDHNGEKTICVKPDMNDCSLNGVFCKYYLKDCVESDDFSTESHDSCGACSNFNRTDKTNVIFLNAE